MAKVGMLSKDTLSIISMFVRGGGGGAGGAELVATVAAGGWLVIQAPVCLGTNAHKPDQAFSREGILTVLHISFNTAGVRCGGDGPR